MSNKFEDLINAAKVSELLHKKELEEKNKNTIVIALAIIGAIAAVAGIAFAVYKYLTPDYLEDFDPDDYSDDFDFLTENLRQRTNTLFFIVFFILTCTDIYQIPKWCIHFGILMQGSEIAQQ